MTRPFEWTAEAIQTLRAMRQDGLSAQVIAERLGTTRSAVIGKASRMKIGGGARQWPTPRSSSPPLRPAQRADKPASHSFAPSRRCRETRIEAAPEAIKPSAYDAGRLPKAVPLADLGIGDCRFAVSANDVAADQHRFCAAPVVDRLVGSETHPHANYCAHHAARVVSSASRDASEASPPVAPAGRETVRGARSGAGRAV